MSALFFYLSHNPEVYRKLAQEVRTTFADGRDIRGGPKLAGCRYLRACIDETLRMSSPVSGTLWRELAQGEEAKGGPIVVDGHVIPRGTRVGVNIYSLHHNEDYFPEPFAFRPERWLVDGDQQQKMHSAFAAFSTGARGCAGKPMAYLESSLVAATTLWYFDFETAQDDVTGPGASGQPGGRESRGEFELRDVFSAAHDGPTLVFRPRADEWRGFDTKEGLKVAH